MPAFGRFLVELFAGGDQLGQHAFQLEDALAGSALTLDRAVRNLVQWLDVPLYEALASAAAVPARSMKLDHVKGIIHPGADADLVFLDADLVVQKTMVGGRIVYSRSTDQQKSRGAGV